MQEKNHELSLQQLVGFLVQEDSTIKLHSTDESQMHSENIARYYDCISGWNPV